MKQILMVVLSLISALALAAETAVLQDIKGKVEVKALGGAWKPATNGMKLDMLATVSTGFDSTAVLAIAENRVSVAPLTRLTIDKILSQAGSLRTNLNLRVGSVSAQVKSSAGIAQEFNVTSPYSTASVRGTQFTYDGLALEVRDGRVAFIPGRPVRDILMPASMGGGTSSQAGESGSPQQGAGSSGSSNTAALMTALQGEFQGDSFSIVNSAGQSITPSGAPLSSMPGQSSSNIPGQIVFVGRGYSAALQIDFAPQSGPARGKPSQIVGGGPALPGQGGGMGGGSGQPMPGGGFMLPPVVRPHGGQQSGSIRVQWN
ncbi:MAG: FecR domain-containing protein [Treponema sp.]|nr:FecR domain-containing protein [Treponema sp.]